MCGIKNNKLKPLVTTLVIMIFQLLLWTGAFAKPTITEIGTYDDFHIQAITEKGQVFGEQVDGDINPQYGFMWENGKMTNLGTLGGSYTSIKETNEKGQVVGESQITADTAYHGFVWENGKMTDLGTLGGSNSCALAINEKGQVVGKSQIAGDTEYHGFIWENGKMVDLGTLGGSNVLVKRINENGQVIGESQIAGDTEYHGFIWENGKMTDLGSLQGENNSHVLQINEKGQILGYTYVEDSFRKLGYPPLEGCVRQRGFIWDNGKMTDLGTLGGTSMRVNEINEKGQVIGVSNLAGDSKQHGFIWQDGKMTDLGLFEPVSINKKGQVVGTVTDQYFYFSHGFVWEDGKLTDLGTLGGSNVVVSAINDNGQVMGEADLPGNYVRHGFIWENGKMTDIWTLGGCSWPCFINENRQVVGISQLEDNSLHVFLWKDPDAPVISISPYDTKLTNKDITVTATTDKGTLNQPGYTFTQNGDFTFTATDSEGNTSIRTVTIANIDKTVPVVTLKGEPVEYITHYGIYKDPGGQAVDDVDGDISSQISVSGSVYTSDPGTYSVTYSVYDRAGNLAVPVSRTVIVIPLTVSEAHVNPASLSDVLVNIGDDNKLYSVVNGSGCLIPDIDYNISGSTVTIKKSYLNYYFKKFPDHNLYLKINFDDGRSYILTIYTGDSPHVVLGEAHLYQWCAEIKLVPNGNFITSVKSGDDLLVPRIDYTFDPAGKVFRILEGYLQRYSSKTSEPLKITIGFTGDPPKTVDFSM